MELIDRPPHALKRVRGDTPQRSISIRTDRRLFDNSLSSVACRVSPSTQLTFGRLTTIMHAPLALLALIPVALGCLNADSNKCASYIKSNAATASPFCASFTKSVVTATTALPAWATNCDNKPKVLSAECSCHYTAGSSPAPTSSEQTTATPTTIITRTTTAAGTGTAPTGVTTVLPQSSGAVATNAPILVSGSLDGGMKLYDRSRKWSSCQK